MYIHIIIKQNDIKVFDNRINLNHSNKIRLGPEGQEISIPMFAYSSQQEELTLLTKKNSKWYFSDLIDYSGLMVVGSQTIGLDQRTSTALSLGAYGMRAIGHLSLYWKVVKSKKDIIKYSKKRSKGTFFNSFFFDQQEFQRFVVSTCVAVFLIIGAFYFANIRHSHLSAQKKVLNKRTLVQVLNKKLFLASPEMISWDDSSVDIIEDSYLHWQNIGRQLLVTNHNRKITSINIGVKIPIILGDPQVEEISKISEQFEYIADYYIFLKKEKQTLLGIYSQSNYYNKTDEIEVKNKVILDLPKFYDESKSAVMPFTNILDLNRRKLKMALDLDAKKSPYVEFKTNKL